MVDEKAGLLLVEVDRLLGGLAGGGARAVPRHEVVDGVVQRRLGLTERTSGLELPLFELGPSSLAVREAGAPLDAFVNGPTARIRGRDVYRPVPDPVALPEVPVECRLSSAHGSESPSNFPKCESA
jgi:hypothetical protein